MRSGYTNRQRTYVSSWRRGGRFGRGSASGRLFRLQYRRLDQGDTESCGTFPSFFELLVRRSLCKGRGGDGGFLGSGRS